jgi:hypothetical protein
MSEAKQDMNLVRKKQQLTSKLLRVLEVCHITRFSYVQAIPSKRPPKIHHLFTLPLPSAKGLIIRNKIPQKITNSFIFFSQYLHKNLSFLHFLTDLSQIKQNSKRILRRREASRQKQCVVSYRTSFFERASSSFYRGNAIDDLADTLVDYAIAEKDLKKCIAMSLNKLPLMIHKKKIAKPEASSHGVTIIYADEQ